MKVSEVITSRVPLQVDLLTVLPTTTDPATWVKPTWPGYQPSMSIPDVRYHDQGIIGKLSCSFDCPPGKQLDAVAFGVSLDGLCVLFGPFFSGLLALPIRIQAEINFTITPQFFP